MTERLDALEQAQDDTGGLSEVQDRLGKLEKTSEQQASDARVEGILERLASLESDSEGAAGAVNVAEITARITDVEGKVARPGLSELTARLQSIEDAGGGMPDPRVDKLLARVASLEHSKSKGGAAGVAELAARIKSMESAGGGGSDPRVNEIVARLSVLEKSGVPGSDGSGAPPGAFVSTKKVTEGFEDLVSRVASLEERGPEGEGSTASSAELQARMEDMERRVGDAENSGGGGNVKALLEQETNRWSNWSRQAGDQLKELRRQVQKLRDREDEGGGAGASPDLAQAIGNSIGNALGKSGDLKTIQTLQTAMAFALAMLYPIVVYVLFKLAE